MGRVKKNKRMKDMQHQKKALNGQFLRETEDMKNQRS